MILLVVTHMMAEPRMMTAKMQNITNLAIVPYFVLVLNLPMVNGAPPSMRLGSEPPL
jgi:hypothetical protein